MIPLKDAMILWGSRERVDKIRAIPRYASADAKTLVKVVPHSDFKGYEKYAFLPCSSGAGSSTWQEASDVARAGSLLALFNWLTVKDGIAPQEVHAAFMDIAEYREYFEQKNYNEETYTNPFWKLHHLREGE